MSERLGEDVKKIVARVIRIPVKKINADADLFKALGADSLKAIEIIVAVEKKYKVKLPLRKLSRIRTIDQIIGLIKDAKKVRV